jgi:hypothetical protein
VDSGRGAADTMGDLLWGHPGDTDHPQTTANGNGSNGDEPAQEAAAAGSRNPIA